MSNHYLAPRRIHFAHGSSKSRKVISAILDALDHRVELVTESGDTLIQRALNDHPDLIIAAPRLSDMDGIEAMIRIGETHPIPGIIIASTDDLDQVERAMEDHVMAYLVEPITVDTLRPAIYLAERRFKHFQSLTDRIESLQTQLEDRKVIERAKGLVMKAKGMTESEAHRFLQSLAKQQRKKIAEVATVMCDSEPIDVP
ncbi:ANTAR domain-containing protein [Rhodopirellula sp. JC740]|uniref:ANTAR domain-containing protein n=1 Tax=Rhodopirellula halodulae TaxID=2894198 RepID=A0ABS8NBY7_9BACT|nr:ANTAR domain-containing protein [Rhodopirellula sp. JC740]MCC9641067.1 ANTAR domain-containing protein [Rhodopirellula sp. JC740]